MAHTEYKHVLHVVELDTTVIAGLRSGNFRSGIDVAREMPSGEPRVRHQSIRERKPQGSFETFHLKTALQNIGLSGVEIDGLASGAKYFLAKTKHGGTIESGANHIRYTVKSGIILPRRLTVDHRGAGTISYDTIVTWDGTNDPIAKTESVSLPSGVTDDERFSLGPVTLNSQAYSAKMRLEVDCGLREDPIGADSEVDDSEVSISDVAPELTLRGIDPNWFGSSMVPLDGVALGHTTATLYLRQRKKGGTFWANGQSKHIKMTVAGLAYLENAFDANERNASETQLRIPLEWDGTNDPIVFAFDQTIA